MANGIKVECIATAVSEEEIDYLAKIFASLIDTEFKKKRENNNEQLQNPLHASSDNVQDIYSLC